ncbi:hypothetical protein DPQ33_03845 [Oceanidesulfovibrio indonesiensis]|uniref:Right handed beta helix domain-containing protein n=2 Tax=Oceanidesulfovibrio indonesiensis TaxID=54767 RepID=A0A7M3MJJ3_9BACT|nr:hypothetical protein DPQ33_03845 [Oceanidesulfovibrio indonesiensis]
MYVWAGCLALLLSSGCSRWVVEEGVLEHCHVCLEGKGDQDGTAPGHAYAWDNGNGLRACLERVMDGGAVHLAHSDEYFLDGTIRLEFDDSEGKSIAIIGSGKSAPGGDYGRSVPSVSNEWPRIVGTRRTSDFGEGGNTFIRIEKGVANLTLSKLRLEKFNTVVSVGSRKRSTQPVTADIADLDVDYAREVISIFGPDKNARLSGWSIRRIHAQGISKRLLRAEGLSNSTVEDVYADSMSRRGVHYKNDWAFLLHFNGPSHDIQVNRFIGKNPAQEQEKYANGDCFSCENQTENISLRNVMCFYPMDSGFDIKGKNHTVTNAAVFNFGNRAFRVWNGPVHFDNIIAAYSGFGDRVSDARGSNAGLWTKGETSVRNYTSLNNDAPIMIDEGGSIKVEDSIYMLTRGFLHNTLSPVFEADGKYEEGNVIRKREDGEADTHFPRDDDPQIMRGFNITSNIVNEKGAGFLGFQGQR